MGSESFGERKYFLDWLRAAAFGALILFHAGMPYVTWDYGIKSERIYPQLEMVMSAVGAWRLALLFFIAGVASRFLLEKCGPGSYAVARIRRLFVVVLVAVVFIIPVQVYVEFLRKGWIAPGYFKFWLYTYLSGSHFPNRVLPTWDHLWFVVYLVFYSLGLALLFKAFRPRGPTRLPLWCLLVLPGIWLCGTNTLIQEVRPVTWALFNDWANHLRWGGIFAAGVVCAAREDFWERVRQGRHWLLVLSAAGLSCQIGNGIYWRTGQQDPAWAGTIYALTEGFYGWVVVLTLIGYAYRYFNYYTAVLGYLTDAVLPIYVVHQPILFVAAYLVLPLSLPVSVEGTLLILITGFGSLTFYELIVRRWRVTRFLFGLKVAQSG
jgi:glucans biosynthesis protein C